MNKSYHWNKLHLRASIPRDFVEAYERKLHRGLGIPAESLIKQVDRRKAP